MFYNSLGDDCVVLLQLVDDFDEILMNLIQLFDGGKVLWHLLFNRLSNPRELLINDFMHMQANGL